VLSEIVILILACGLVILGWNNLQSSPLSVFSVHWETEDSEATLVPQGETATLVLLLRAQENVIGHLEINIKKDVQYYKDEVVYTTSIPLNVDAGQNQSFEINFTPQEASEGRLEGYFAELVLDGESIYTMPSSYPPRLKVLKAKLSVADVKWFVWDLEVTNAEIGDRVTGVLYLTVSNANLSGLLELVAKRDLQLGPDEDVTRRSYHLSMPAGSSFNVSVDFDAAYVTERVFRGYFLELLLNGDKVYTMPSSYPPRLTVYR
jgi:hypothetical protein